MTPFQKWCDANGYDPRGTFIVTSLQPGETYAMIGDELAIVKDDGTDRPLFKGCSLGWYLEAPMSLSGLTQGEYVAPDSPKSLRDEFAIAVLKELIAGNRYTFSQMAECAYQIADVMMEARKASEEAK